MEYRQLGKTDLQVSAICLGTMTFGEQNSQDEAFEQLDYAIACGINFIDTAELYPVPGRAETMGRTEEQIGNWLAARGNRDQVIVASKVVGRADWMDHIRGAGNCLSRENIRIAIEDSLRRLQTDYIDLYQVHWPDRPSNFFGQLGYKYPQQEKGVPIAETLEALAELVSEGKVRHVGVSNETPWGVAEYLRLSREQELPRIQSVQNPYSLLNRTFEVGLAEFSHREAVGLLAYSPMAFGVLSGKYLQGRMPEGSRLKLFSHFDRYSNPRAVAAIEAYVGLAKEWGIDPAQMALAYVTSRPFVTSNIIGATSMQQLETNIASFGISLDKELVKAIDGIHEEHPNPSP
ncbi:NADP(H)-dependent aldo-keto reductase [Solemya velum gill symbiont]|uniref:NADP(H)-dependent aldo-keto reductase n=1 Tax=Solemya velum gill symbiont TaxID=2340 RepID=UPI000996D961|nr:NADP(H)-dependent aldo-keto reductase [Solemya velum gill symbiont]OOY53706.1 aldo/keto reductase [Solemya velum gill symbiont]OOY57498.1 aldo/keto reductase [Solemya velum gill symbiont]OOY58522.1 aldo/keto reductase [Solemya velum gill symbiont]OOY61166.1 aldo/keto reductase [Solemya velum gill symbiont]OOY62694.1 aldo/keto reductase [Solemya velum gill symbiont]